MRVVVGLGGNALLPRGEPLTHEVQGANVVRAVTALADVGAEHELIVTHGNGPQVGLLAVQDQAMPGQGHFPLDVLSAETEGMIGYLLARELRNVLPGRQVVTILTQVEVDPGDPALARATKPVGPVYTSDRAERLKSIRGWRFAPDRDGYRRVVPSPAPVRLLEIEAIRMLVEAGTVVICAGGGGIPVVFDPWGRAHGVEAVIDKDRAAALVAEELNADALLLLTDVAGVFEGWGRPDPRLVVEATPDRLEALRLPAGSMGPKVEAAARFVRRTGGMAGIGAVDDAVAVLRGEAGTRVMRTAGAAASIPDDSGSRGAP